MTINIEGFGKVTATKDVLNRLCILFDNSSELYKRKYEEKENEVHLFLSKFESERASQIYKELKKSGLYDK